LKRPALNGDALLYVGLLSAFCVVLTLCGVGFILIGLGSLVLGSICLVFCRGALGTLFVAASRLFAEDLMKALTRNQTWRDIGAAAGPLLTGMLLSVISAEEIHLLMFGLFIVTASWFFGSGDYARLRHSGR